ncbi:MAG: class B sortase [Lachnospiraceae bacterium]|nr:class B sortase [Candidatus Equihabitans merdae]
MQEMANEEPEIPEDATELGATGGSNLLGYGQGSTGTIATDEELFAFLGIVVPSLDLNWEEMQAVNPDIYAWLYYPGLNINYPLVQSPSDDNYYLKHNIDGSAGFPGCIYTQSLNAKDFTDFNTVIYGHNMKNGTMFGSLDALLNEETFNNNRYAFIYRPDGKTLVYDIYAAYGWSDEHLLKDYSYETVEDRQAYLDKVYAENNMTPGSDAVSLTDTMGGDTSMGNTTAPGNVTSLGNTTAPGNVTAVMGNTSASTAGSNCRFSTVTGPTPDNHIITLSTCISSDPKARFLVQGVLVNE